MAEFKHWTDVQDDCSYKIRTHPLQEALNWFEKDKQECDEVAYNRFKKDQSNLSRWDIEQAFSTPFRKLTDQNCTKARTKGYKFCSKRYSGKLLI